MAYFDYYSRYGSTQAILSEGVQTIGMWTAPGWIRQRPGNNFISTYRVEAGFAGRPDLIAQAVYGNQKLDWVLVMFNRPAQIFGWPRVGTIIECPAESLVLMEL